MRLNKDRLQMYVSLTKITIVLCWLSLFSFWAIKLFGGNWFAIIVNNENFLAFSNAVQNTWVKYLVSLFTIVTLKYLSICAICQKFYFKGKSSLILFVVLVANWAIVNFLPLEYSFISSNFAYIVFIIYGLVYQTKFKKLYGVLAIVFDIAFSGISILVRNIELQIITDYLILLILCIDIYIMTTLYYLYSNLKKLER